MSTDGFEGRRVTSPDPGALLADAITSLRRRVEILERRSSTPSSVMAIAPVGSSSGWSIGTAVSTIVQTSLIVPDGYTAVTIAAVAAAHFEDGSSGQEFYLRTSIAGRLGPEYGGKLGPSNLVEPALGQADLTGLSAGQTIPILVRARAKIASTVGTGRTAQVLSIAVFRRS